MTRGRRRDPRHRPRARRRVPLAARSPLKALDDQAMDLASAGRRAAGRAVPLRRRRARLPRRSTTSPAHLTGFLDEVDDRPLPLDVAMRMGGSRPGRAALAPPPRRASGTWRTASSSARRRSDAGASCAGCGSDGVATSVDLLGEATVTAAEADRYAARCAEALDDARRGLRRAARAARARGRRAGPDRRARTSRSRSPRSRRCCAPTPPSSASATPRRACASCCAAPRTLGAHLHIDMESFDSREAITDLVLELLAEDEFRDGPSAGLVLQAYLRDSPELCDADPRRGPRDAARARRWSSAWSRAPTGTTRSSRPRQHGWSAAGLRGQGRVATATSRR